MKLTSKLNEVESLKGIKKSYVEEQAIPPLNWLLKIGALHIFIDYKRRTPKPDFPFSFSQTLKANHCTDSLKGSGARS